MRVIKEVRLKQLPKECCKSLICRVPRRLKEVIKSREGLIKYRTLIKYGSMYMETTLSELCKLEFRVKT